MWNPSDGPESAEELIDSSFFKKYSFSKPIRYWSERDEQFCIYYEIDGYDCKILIKPTPQIVPNDYNMFGDGIHIMPPEIQVDEFSDIEMLENHHIGDYQVYVNTLQNHVATFNYKWQLIKFFELCDCPLIEANV